MLDKRYGMKYPMPHSVVHIIDNSMYTGDLPITIADDPSLYSSIVVTGAPMGADNEIIPINRSDVLNIAYGMSTLTASDIKKYGQTVTYPSSLISQNVPIKFMRVTPEDATYAFSCILMQWRWDNNKIHVRYRTTDDSNNNGLPTGVIHSNFKNPQKLHNALVNAFKTDFTDSDGVWTQRVIMTTIAAGRGKIYNNYNFAINRTQQSKRPANVRYLFSTINTRDEITVEQFFGSLINENNQSRVDATESVNVQVGKRVKGSSILIPTINESAIHELYDEYMSHVQDKINDNVPPEDSSESSTDDIMKFVHNVYVTMNPNIFDVFYGRYIYNGDTDVKLPYFQVEMFDLDIPKLDTQNQIKTYLDTNETVKDYVDDPSDFINKLTEKMYGITNPDNTYHVGDVFLNTQTKTLYLIITINQYTGAITSIPIASVYEINSSGEKATGSFRACISVASDDVSLIAEKINDLINSKKLTPRVVKKQNVGDPDTYKSDYVLVQLEGKAFTHPKIENAKTFGIAKVDYKSNSTGGIEVDTENTKLYTSQTDIYSMLVYPNNISFFTNSKSDSRAKTPGTTIIEVDSYKKFVEPVPDTSTTQKVFITDYSGDGYFSVANNGHPFIVGTCPSSVSVNQSIVNTAYDDIIYKLKPGSNINWIVKNGTPISDSITNPKYVVDDELQLTENTNIKFKVTSVTDIKSSTDDETVIGQTVSIAISNNSTTSSTKIRPGIYTTTNNTHTEATGLTISIRSDDIDVEVGTNETPVFIQRYNVTGTTGSLYRYGLDTATIPTNYYSDTYGLNPTSELGGIPVKHGYAGFFDDNISDIEFKWRYSELLVRAYKGYIDPRIQSPTRCPAKYLFDGGTNTIVGQTILPYMVYKPIDIINASTIYTDDEKEAILLNKDLIKNITEFTDIDVKQAMYDLAVYRCYYGIPEDKRPIGPGSGLSLHLDSGITDANTTIQVNSSFIKRFSNPNVSWEIGGYVSAVDGNSYTYVKKIVDSLFSHMKQYSVNKPFVGKYTNITPQEYTSFFPDIDTTDWEMRELLYNSGGNAWIADVNQNLQRKSQRTLYRDSDTSDIIQENNMRTLSQLIYILQNKIDTYLLEYNDDGVLKTLKDEVDNLFSHWVGNLVQALDITFERDINPNDGGEIVVCYCNVTFRGLILRVPIIVNIQRRQDSE